MTWKTADITDEMVCRAYAEQTETYSGRGYVDPPGRLLPDDFADAVLMRETGAPLKVACRAMERASDRGLIDYGVTLRSGWLTDKGRALIKRKGGADAAE